MKELTLMLLYLSRFTQGEKFYEAIDFYAWKGYDFDILNKLLRKGRRPEKFGKEKERLENLKKRLKKVLDKANCFWYTK